MQHAGARHSVVACKLLAALDGDSAQRSLCSVIRLAEHARPPRGASWLAARRPRRGGNAGLVQQPIVRPFGGSWCRSISQSITGASDRVRTKADGLQHLENNATKSFLKRKSLVECDIFMYMSGTHDRYYTVYRDASRPRLPSANATASPRVRGTSRSALN